MDPSSLRRENAQRAGRGRLRLAPRGVVLVQRQARPHRDRTDPGRAVRQDEAGAAAIHPPAGLQPRGGGGRAAVEATARAGCLGPQRPPPDLRANGRQGRHRRRPRPVAAAVAGANRRHGPRDGARQQPPLQFRPAFAAVERGACPRRPAVPRPPRHARSARRRLCRARHAGGRPRHRRRAGTGRQRHPAGQRDQGRSAHPGRPDRDLAARLPHHPQVGRPRRRTLRRQRRGSAHPAAPLPRRRLPDAGRLRDRPAPRGRSGSAAPRAAAAQQPRLESRRSSDSHDQQPAGHRRPHRRRQPRRHRRPRPGRLGPGRAPVRRAAARRPRGDGACRRDEQPPTAPRPGRSGGTDHAPPHPARSHRAPATGCRSRGAEADPARRGTASKLAAVHPAVEFPARGLRRPVAARRLDRSPTPRSGRNAGERPVAARRPDRSPTPQSCRNAG